MKFKGVMDIVQQHDLLSKRNTSEIEQPQPFNPRKDARYFCFFCDVKCVEGLADERTLLLEEATILVSNTRLPQLAARFRKLLDNSMSSRQPLFITTAACPDSAEDSSRSIGKVDALGGYMCCRKWHKRDNFWRYTALQKIFFSFDTHEAESIASFLDDIADKIADYDFPYGVCTFEYPYWEQALKECCTPRFIVIVTPEK